MKSEDKLRDCLEGLVVGKSIQIFKKLGSNAVHKRVVSSGRQQLQDVKIEFRVTISHINGLPGHKVALRHSLRFLDANSVGHRKLHFLAIVPHSSSFVLPWTPATPLANMKKRSTLVLSIRVIKCRATRFGRKFGEHKPMLVPTKNRKIFYFLKQPRSHQPSWRSPGPLPSSSAPGGPSLKGLDIDTGNY